MRASTILAAASCAVLATAVIAAQIDTQSYSDSNCNTTVGAPFSQTVGECMNVGYTSYVTRCSADGAFKYMSQYNGLGCVAARMTGVSETANTCTRTSATTWAKATCNGTTDGTFPTAGATIVTSCTNVTDSTQVVCAIVPVDTTIVCSRSASYAGLCSKTSGQFVGSSRLTCGSNGLAAIQYSDDSCMNMIKATVQGTASNPPAPRCPVTPAPGCPAGVVGVPALPSTGLITFKGAGACATSTTVGNVAELYPTGAMTCANNMRLTCTAALATLETFTVNTTAPYDCSGTATTTVSSIQPAAACANNQILSCNINAAAAAAGINIPAAGANSASSAQPMMFLAAIGSVLAMLL